MVTKYVQSKDGTRIAYEQSGNGPALILVGGAFVFRAMEPKMKQLAALLADDFTVVHYDRRGRGESGSTMPYSIEREIEDIRGLIEESGGEAFVYGISSGGALGLKAASKRIGIKKLAVYEVPFHHSEPEQLWDAKEYTKQLNALLAEGKRGEAAALALARFGIPPQVVEGMRNSPAWPGFESVAPTLAYDDAILGDGSVPTDLLKSVTTPVLVLDGGASPPFMHIAAVAIAKGLPNSKRLTLQGQTHDVNPEVLAPVLKDFFQ